ncbi:Rha family transcriptional regulator [Psychrobacter pygoscelis]|uniref:Rha family transcriptional regulator n=1 Tax=Psychrobacter pygoscelis TaxID=2488563 RepID=UPI00103A3E2A|nr:Rha family transcriptional regulator [Psychrobacter pygoscelis]
MNQSIENKLTHERDITMNLPILQDQTTQMTSREIAGLTGKKLYHVNRDVLAMFKELNLDKSRFGSIYFDNKNRKQVEYILDKELTFTLITGYSIKLRNAVVKRWLELESHTESLQDELNKWCAKEDYDKAVGSLHGKGLAERKKTKNLNTTVINGLVQQMQFKIVFDNDSKNMVTESRNGAEWQNTMYQAMEMNQ